MKITTFQHLSGVLSLASLVASTPALATDQTAAPIPAPPPPAATPDPAPAPPASVAPPDTRQAAPQASQQPAPPANDPRDQELRELRRTIEELRRRVEELEKRPAPPEAPAPPAAPEAPPAPARPSATFLPNISAIGNSIFNAGDSRAIPSRGRFNFTEFELAIQDAVAPGLRYDVFLAAAKEEEWGVGLEEGYLSATRLAPGLSARIGRIRTPIGKFNPLHPHQWPFITQPTAVTNLLGPEGLSSDGAVVEYLFPVRGFFLRAEAGRWETTSEAEDGLGFGGGESGAYSGRVWLGKDLGRNREIELGASRYWGRGAVDGFGRTRKALTGVDLSYRAYPASYQRIWLSAELFDHETLNAPGGTRNRLGGFLTAAYRWNRYWEGGFRGDYSRRPFPTEGTDWGGSLFITRYLTEQTSLRLEYQYARSPEFRGNNGVFFQILFGSGPHTHPLR